MLQYDFFSPGRALGFVLRCFRIGKKLACRPEPSPALRIRKEVREKIPAVFAVEGEQAARLIEQLRNGDPLRKWNPIERLGAGVQQHDRTNSNGPAATRAPTSGR